MDIRTEHLLGSWNLLSWTRIGPGGTVSYPYGKEAKGRLTYDVSDLVRGFFINADYKKVDGRPAQPMVVSYIGHYNLDGDVINHKVELSCEPTLTGATIRPQITLKEDIMILNTLPSMGRAKSEPRYKQVWQKVQ